MNTDENGGAVGLLSLDPLDVDAELFPVDLDHLSHLLSLVADLDVPLLLRLQAEGIKFDEQGVCNYCRNSCTNTTIKIPMTAGNI